MQMTSWENRGWRNHNGDWENGGWDFRSRGQNDRSRGWAENQWRWRGYSNNEGGGQWPSWGEVVQGDISETEEGYEIESAGLRGQYQPQSYYPRNNEETAIEAPNAPQSRPSDDSEPMKVHIASPCNYRDFRSTPVLQPLDSDLNEDLREAYQAKQEQPVTSSTNPTAVEVPGTSSKNPTAVAETSTEVAQTSTAVAETLEEEIIEYTISELVVNSRGTFDVVAFDRPTGAFDLAYFEQFRPFTSNYKQHNVALKWFRLLAERESRSFVVFDNDRPIEVPMCDHPKGMEYSFDETRTREWTWQEMIAQLDAESMKRLVEGPYTAVAEGMNAAVVEGGPQLISGCALVKTDRYDHKRNHALKDHTTVYHIWDFVFFRSDGSQIGCHPNYSSTKFESYEGVARTDHELPKGGKGGSSGRGTYKYFKKKGIDLYLRFDAEKKPPRTHTRQRE